MPRTPSAAKAIAIVPGISAQGFRVAVRDYKERHVIEELAANSYDADASTVLVLTDGDQLHIIDDGKGFGLEAVRQVAVLGAGEKSSSDFSGGRRPFLGCYGFGLKSTLNIAKKVEIKSTSLEGAFYVQIDWTKLEEGLKGNSDGFKFTQSPRGRAANGTHIELTLKAPVGDPQLDEFESVLSNLPQDDGRFRCYCGRFEDVRKNAPTLLTELGRLRNSATRLARRKLLRLSDISADADLKECETVDIRDKDDKTVAARFYFGGLEGGKVRSIKKSLRGIYVRINGRLLKQSFDDQKYVYSISKWVKFAAGLRVELSIDWLRNEISLSRDGVQFSNSKLEEQFRTALVRLVTRFIQPELKKLERKAERHIARKYEQRMELGDRRVKNPKSLRVPGLANGFCFKPETDGELALLLSQQTLLRKLNSGYRLIDYNDQASFDCLIWDESRKEFIKAELEPTLIEFLAHKDAKDVQLVITWSTGKWRIGAKKRGTGGWYKLISEPEARAGHYKLLVYATQDSKKVKRHYPVVVLDQICT
jgi:hypothetical protein